MRQWWNNATISKFRQRAQCIVDQYGSYKLEPFGHQVSLVSMSKHFNFPQSTKVFSWRTEFSPMQIYQNCFIIDDFHEKSLNWNVMLQIFTNGKFCRFFSFKSLSKFKFDLNFCSTIHHIFISIMLWNFWLNYFHQFKFLINTTIN